MKRLLYMLLASFFMSFYGCKDDESGFQTNVSEAAFSFTPIAGGAIMHYTIPGDPEIIALNIRYKDVNGKSILRTGSMLSDSLVLVGFNEARQGVQAQVTLCKRNYEESKPITVSFDTKDSGPISFFDKAQVIPGWNGFSVLVDNVINTSGMAHVFYLGKDPLSNKPDTILVGSFSLREGTDTLSFQLKQLAEHNSVVLRTEDFRGYIVREKVWENVKSYNTEKLEPSKFDFICATSVESERDMLGKKYLFDGDTKGETWLGTVADKNKYTTFLSGPNGIGVGAPMYIDLKESRITAEIRIYGMLNVGHTFQRGNYAYAFGSDYGSRLPSSVIVYAAKGSDNNDWKHKEWVKIGNYKEDRELYWQSRWSSRCEVVPPEVHESLLQKVYKSLEELDAVDPCFLSVLFLVEGQGEGYRYLKIVVDDTYYPKYTPNVLDFTTFHELEVYTQKD